MTGAETLAFIRDIVVTVGMIGGAVGAIGIQRWRVAKLESEVQGLKQRVKIAEVTSYGNYLKSLKDMKATYETEMAQAIETARREGKDKIAEELEHVQAEVERLVKEQEDLMTYDEAFDMIAEDIREEQEEEARRDAWTGLLR